ncbi:hypothetical protein HDU98_000137 [Podochytrium sp. JEL0797]|nr:hypothetical protein HDU98_000137 [Podochytrium sp. JEL0797]
MIETTHIDYNAVEKNGPQVWTKVGLEQCAEMLRETDNRNPEVFGLKTAPKDFTTCGQLEVLENQLRTVLKHFKLAMKKKSPQSAWKPVYASLEAITIYLQTNHSWVKDALANPKVAKMFSAYGCAWVQVAEKLMEFGSFNENQYPSVRCAVQMTLHLGGELNAMVAKPMSDWPAKLECVWTGAPYAGDKKKKEKTSDDAPKKKSGKAKKHDDFESDEDDDAAAKKKKKHAKKAAAAASATEAVPSNPWDFEEACSKLKGDRKSLGGAEFDIAVMTEEMRVKLSVAA